MEDKYKTAKIKYNATYYAKHKDKIAEKLYAKEACNMCSRVVTHQNLPKHKKSNYCRSHSEKQRNELNENEVKQIKKTVTKMNLKEIERNFDHTQNGYDGFSDDK